MAFLSSANGGGGRISPPGRGGRQLAHNGILPRDKMSRIGFLSIVLVVYSGITLGLILWNQSSGETHPAAPGEAAGPWHDDARAPIAPPSLGVPGVRKDLDMGNQWLASHGAQGNGEDGSGSNGGAVGVQNHIAPKVGLRGEGVAAAPGAQDENGAGRVLPVQEHPEVRASSEAYIAFMHERINAGAGFDFGSI